MIDTEVTVDFPVDSITARTKRCLRKIVERQIKYT